MDIEGLRNVQRFVKRSIKKQESADASDNGDEQLDGGPGSGNWGHAGRPGQEGGSASGGGKQFRLDKPGGGYTGLVWAYRSNEAYNKGGKEALVKAVNQPESTFSGKAKTKAEQGTSAKQAVEELRAKVKSEHRQASSEELVEIGKLIDGQIAVTRAEAEANVKKAQDVYDSFRKDEEEFYKQHDGAVYDKKGKFDSYASLMNAKTPEGEYEKPNGYTQSEIDLRSAKYALDNADKAGIRAGLESVREMGIEGVDMKEIFTVKGKGYDADKLGNAMELGYGFYPTEWVKKTKMLGGITVVESKERGYFEPSDMSIGMNPNSMKPNKYTAVHEIGHSFEVVQDLVKYEQDYYKKRTAGEKLEPLGFPYEADEKTRKDKFMDPYMGKDYGGEGYELLSMGFELLYSDPVHFKAKDPDMYYWCLGILAAG